MIWEALALAGLAAVLWFVLSIWERWRFAHRTLKPTHDENLNRDQYRPESAIRLATMQGKSSKGFAGRDRMAGVVEKKERVN